MSAVLYLRVLNMKTAIAPSCLLFVLIACNPAIATPIATPTAMPTATPWLNITSTQRSAVSPTKILPEVASRYPHSLPTPAPTATPLPPLVPTKQTLLQYGVFGGDGGSNTDFYMGRDTPQLILYTDGQLLMRQKQGNWYMQATLTTPQICYLLSHIERTGFFDVEGDGGDSTTDPIYDFGGTPQFSGDGTPAYLIQINGERHKLVNIEPGYAPYLVQPVKTTLQIVKNYSPGTPTLPFKTNYLVLWIEKGLGNAAHSDPQPTPQPWPSRLPSLAKLLDGKNEGQVFIEGE